MLRYTSIIIAAAALLIGCLAVLSSAEDQPAVQQIWGTPINGVTISAVPTKTSYKIEDKIEIKVNMKNVGDALVSLPMQGSADSYYKLALFYPDGRPVPLTEAAQEAMQWPSTPGVVSVTGPPITSQNENNENTEGIQEFRKSPPPPRRYIIRMQPGQIAEETEVLCVSDWFKIDKPGSYTLIAMRRLTSWDAGFPVSNAVKIEVTE